MKICQLEFTCIWDLRAELGEGPVWDDTTQTLYFVDVKQHRVCSYHFPTGEKKIWSAPGQISFIFPRQGGGLICGIGKTICLFSPETEKFFPLLFIKDGQPHTRLNDAYVDHAGRLWFGTMDDKEKQPLGGLYSMQFEGNTPFYTMHDQGYCVSNGPVFNASSTFCLHTDSASKTIYAFEKDKLGHLVHKRVFSQLNKTIPDGMAFDKAGTIWVALYEGGGLYRYSHEGEILAFVPLAVPHVTKPAFGGPHYQHLFVTTAAKGLNEGEKGRYPKAGGLFVANVEHIAVQGCVQPEVYWPIAPHYADRILHESESSFTEGHVTMV